MGNPAFVFPSSCHGRIILLLVSLTFHHRIAIFPAKSIRDFYFVIDLRFSHFNRDHDRDQKLIRINRDPICKKKSIRDLHEKIGSRLKNFKRPAIKKPVPRSNPRRNMKKNDDTDQLNFSQPYRDFSGKIDPRFLFFNRLAIFLFQSRS
jgi:hypothetical protein